MSNIDQSQTAAAPAAAPTGQAPPPPAPPAQPPPPPPVTGVANGSNTGTKVDLQTSYVALVTGLLAFYQPGDQFPLAGGDKTRDQLVADFNAFIQAAETTKTCQQEWRNAVQAERQSEASVKPLRQGVRSIVEAKFGKGAPQLLQFGFKPRKASTKSSATKAAAAVKTAATRKARGTKGSVQKLEVSGDVAGVIITPVTSVPQVATTGQVTVGVPDGSVGGAAAATPAAQGNGAPGNAKPAGSGQ